MISARVNHLRKCGYRNDIHIRSCTYISLPLPANYEICQNL